MVQRRIKNMDRKELTEAFKIIYDALSEGKDSEKEIAKLKDDLRKRDFLTKSLIRVMIPTIKTTHLSLNSEITPYDVARYMKDFFDHMLGGFGQEDRTIIDDKFIDEVVNLMNQKWK